MKKMISLVLALALVCSLSVMAFAEQPEGASTEVIYNAANKDAYWEITVPQTINLANAAPSDQNVKVEGEWSSAATLTLTADTTVEMSSTLTGSVPVDLNVVFTPNGGSAGSALVINGSNTAKVSGSANVYVQNFNPVPTYGNWTGTFYYKVSFNSGN